MKKWDYKLLLWKQVNLYDLKSLGGEGWELVQIIQCDNKFAVYLKREKEK